MAVLVEDNNSLFRVESICWSCTEAYADKCKFHDRISGYTWEEKLEIPNKVATKEVGISSKPGQKTKYTSYKVLECPSYKPSTRKKAEQMLIKELLKEKGEQRKKENALSKTKASKHVPSIEAKTKASKHVPSIEAKTKASKHVPSIEAKTKASKHVPSIETSNLNACIICGTPTVDSIFCSNLCKAMGSGLSARGRKA
jgi:desulfoferrodoxin (superoxide reductase-like protein)